MNQQKMQCSAHSLPVIPTWLDTQRKLAILLSKLRRYIKDFIMSMRGKMKEWSESDKRKKRHDCESETMRKEQDLRKKMDCRAAYYGITFCSK